MSNGRRHICLKNQAFCLGSQLGLKVATSTARFAVCRASRPPNVENGHVRIWAYCLVCPENINFRIWACCLDRQAVAWMAAELRKRPFPHLGLLSEGPSRRTRFSDPLLNPETCHKLLGYDCTTPKSCDVFGPLPRSPFLVPFSRARHQAHESTGQQPEDNIRQYKTTHKTTP